MTLATDDWTIGHLRAHLQYAVELELWTIPFYMSALFSIVDRSSAAYQFVQSVVHQEMLHLQLASNIANAYGLSPRFDAPRYVDQAIPHLDFSIDRPDPRPEFSPFSAEIGPLDAERVNAMCLVEFPEWGQSPPDLHDNVTEYGSIGAFYDAVELGARLLQSDLRGGVRQVDFFSAFYRDLPALTVSDSGPAGFRQVALLLSVIRAQGEGDKGRGDLPPPFRNTADDGAAAQDHYEKFLALRGAPLPATYPVRPADAWSERARDVQADLIASFDELRGAMAAMFAGGGTGRFVAVMVKVGAGIQACWKRGIVPRFS
jgi:Ferritin-like